MSNPSPKIAIVYDRINKIGGAEKVLQSLHQIWPQAPLYTMVYHPKTARWAKNYQVKTSFVNHLPFTRKNHEWFAWLAPIAFESFDFSDFDIVISVTSAEAKGIITPPSTLHISYLLTPTRYLWSHTQIYQTGNYITNKNIITKKITPLIFSHLRKWDQIAAHRPDHLVAISDTVAQRTKKYYHRQTSGTIYPPVNPISKKTDQTLRLPRKYFLLVSRLVPYKRIDIAIQAFNQLGLKLIIVGSGDQAKYLKSISKQNIEFTGRISQKKLNKYYKHAQALIFPSEEDFGIVCVEAQSAGKPVIAFGRAGAAETVIHNKTGILFKNQTPQALVTAVEKFDKNKFNADVCMKNAYKFSADKFKQSFSKFIEEAWQNHQKQK